MALDLTDKSQNSNDLTNAGVDEETGSTPFGASTKAGGYVLANTDYAYAAHHTSIAFNSDFTLEAWIYMGSLASSNGANMAIINKDDSDDGRAYIFEIQSADDKLTCSFRDASVNKTIGKYDTAFVEGDLDTWIHVAVAVDISVPSMEFYINGSGVSETMTFTNATSISQGDSPLTIGARYTGAASEVYWDGYLDEIRIWDDIRTSTEISNNYDQHLSNPASEANLQAYYPWETLSAGTALKDIIMAGIVPSPR